MEFFTLSQPSSVDRRVVIPVALRSVSEVELLIDMRISIIDLQYTGATVHITDSTLDLFTHWQLSSCL